MLYDACLFLTHAFWLFALHLCSERSKRQILTAFSLGITMWFSISFEFLLWQSQLRFRRPHAFDRIILIKKYKIKQLCKGNSKDPLHIEFCDMWHVKGIKEECQVWYWNACFAWHKDCPLCKDRYWFITKLQRTTYFQMGPSWSLNLQSRSKGNKTFHWNNVSKKKYILVNSFTYQVFLYLLLRTFLRLIKQFWKV